MMLLVIRLQSKENQILSEESLVNLTHHQQVKLWVTDMVDSDDRESVTRVYFGSVCSSLYMIDLDN